jgi:hypothetical protein
MVDGIIQPDAMTGAQYHVAIYGRRMVSKPPRPLIHKAKQAKRATI